MSHRNARLTVFGRRLLVERVRSGRPVAHVAAEMGISRATAHKWIRRWRTEGEAGLHDRSSRPHTTPHRTASAVKDRVCDLRQGRKLGPARIGPIVGLPTSTVHRILTRHRLNRLAWIDRPTGTVIRRYERERPGELIHVDVKKLGRIPDGGGHKTNGREAGRPIRGMGFDYVHSGRSRGGLTSKIHLACDGRGRPLAFTVTAGTRNDCTQAEAVIDRIRVTRAGPGRPRTRPDRLVADKGYSARSFRAYLRRRGIKATIPERVDQLAGRRRRRERPCGFDRAVYRRRNVVERCFHRLKQWRDIATRYGKQPNRYRAAITLASTLIWLDT
ncbi:IS5 family transposase [Streptomyces sp. ATE26]|uniref:IS5 family transposase n=1 Tax=Streptomyces sp. ATE26 TaxID=2954237 RepID=UPI0024831A35|nr:IS5 family transposase [Streptomyces sp. ATE26]MDI1456485.1 IS5 family transposase [Streptomyces sp. ATE26]